MQLTRVLAGLIVTLPAFPASTPSPTVRPLVLESQGSFFIGGTVRRAPALSSSETDAEAFREGDITTGQMYVQYHIPFESKHIPVVMIHGGFLSGQAYESTPDGRMGWSEYFLRAGRPVYAVDQAGRGRSGFDATIYNSVRLGKKSPAAQPCRLRRKSARIWRRSRS